MLDTVSLPLNLPFQQEEFASRLARVQAEMTARNIDVLLVHSPENTYYLTGFRTSGYYAYMMLVVPASGLPIHLARSIEKVVLEATSIVQEVEYFDDTESPVNATIRLINDKGWGASRIGIDKLAWYLTIADFEALRSGLQKVTWIDSSLIIETIRLIKSPAEQSYSRKAAAAASVAMKRTLEAIREGITEDDLMAEAYNGLLSVHSEFPAVPPQTNSGIRHTMFHSFPESNPITRGDAVYCEVYASVKRYHAATLRIGFVGPAPKLFYDLIDLCNRSFDAGLKLMRPGVPAEEIDRATRKIILDAGYGDHYRTQAGYSIGIGYPPNPREAQAFSLKGGEKRVLQPGMIFYLLPALSQYNKFGVATTETVLITETGYEILTNVEQKLFVTK
jgi:Xaa-Pro dipeptidase